MTATHRLELDAPFGAAYARRNPGGAKLAECPAIGRLVGDAERDAQLR